MCFSNLKLKQNVKVLRYCISSAPWDLKQITIIKLIVDASFNRFFKSLQEISGTQAFLQTLQRSAGTGFISGLYCSYLRFLEVYSQPRHNSKLR